MQEHRRREGYWRVYHLAHTHERDATVADIVSLVMENRPPPRRRRTRRGRKRVHSWDKLVCISLIMVAMNWTFREAEGEVPHLNLP